jgi:dihydropteroate synthase
MSFKNTHLPIASLLQSKGNLLDLSQPIVMGIINTTPDSFYSESRKQNLDAILAQAEQMSKDGAKILDIGGVSTRPNATEVSADEEMERTIPAIEAMSKQFPSTWISIDTYRTAIAKAAIDAGAHIVNDISGGLFDEKMMETVAKLNVPYIAMHNKGTVQTMHQNFQYNNITIEVLDDLQKIVDKCVDTGIRDLILDPGFGFAKNTEHNFELLNNMAQLRLLGKPILAGISRKSMIYKSLNTDAPRALNGTTALNMVALQQGANILRVHDVKEAVEAVHLFGLL